MITTSLPAAMSASARLLPMNPAPPVTSARLTSSLDREPEAAGDDEALDLARALADLEDLRVSVEARHRRVVHEAVATEHLRRLARRRDRGFGCVELRDRGLVLVRQA